MARGGCLRAEALHPASCSVAAPGSAFCTLSSSQWHWTQQSKSVVSQFGLVCSKSVLAQLVNSAFFLGYLIGSGVFGTMADVQGRRKTLLVSLGAGCPCLLFCERECSYFTNRR
jgi:OCT family organic cation transporter-like MFS transporter 4/5